MNWQQRTCKWKENFNKKQKKVKSNTIELCSMSILSYVVCACILRIKMDLYFFLIWNLALFAPLFLSLNRKKKKKNRKQIWMNCWKQRHDLGQPRFECQPDNQFDERYLRVRIIVIHICFNEGMTYNPYRDHHKHDGMHRPILNIQNERMEPLFVTTGSYILHDCRS